MRAVKKIYIAATGLIVLLVIALTTVVLFVDVNSYRAKIESAASGATGLDVKIRGKMGLSLFPFGASARDIRITGKTGEILSSEELKIGVALLPLLRKEISVSGCKLLSPTLTIEKDSSGRYNFQGVPKKQEKRGPGSALVVDNITISRGALVYIDRRSGDRIELKGVDASIRDLSIKDTSGDIVSGLSFYGKMDCKTVRRKTLKAENLRASFKTEKGVFSIPISVDVFGAKGKGDVVMDMSRPAASYKIDFSVPDLDFARLAESYSSKKTVGGRGELSVAVNMKGKYPMSSMEGTFSLRGDNLTTYALDLDRALSKFESSQEVNLVDLGAFLVAGPLGPAATAGSRIGGIFTQTGGGEGRIRRLVSDWKIHNGVAAAVDCALATKGHRIALRGRLDLARERFDGVVVALIDEKGCAKYSQQINGPFNSPGIGAVSAAQTLLGPILNLFGRAKGAAAGGRCEVFYSGSVRP